MVSIERTLENGYEDKEYDIKEALEILNLELENSRSIWIDNKLFEEQIIKEEDIVKSKKVCVTNRLIGG